MNWAVILAGLIAGAAGAMGLGGGFVLILYLQAVGMSAPEAGAANLMFFIPTAAVSMLINRRNGFVDTSVLPYAAAAGSIGAVIGLMLGGVIDGELLRTCFAFLITAVGVKELFHRKEKDRDMPPQRRRTVSAGQP